MSQQEFFSEELGQELRESEIQAEPYYWSTRPKSKTGAVPKNEHPSTYEESMPPYSYRAQDSTSYTSQQKNSAYRANTRQQRSHSDSDGDAFEHGDRPYSAYNVQWQVPTWARPQHNNNTWRTAVFVVLGLLLIVPALKVIAFLLVLFGVALLAIVLLPIALAFLAVFVSIAFLVLAVVGVPVRPWRRRGFRPWQRIPWGW